MLLSFLDEHFENKSDSQQFKLFPTIQRQKRLNILACGRISLWSPFDIWAITIANSWINTGSFQPVYFALPAVRSAVFIGLLWILCHPKSGQFSLRRCEGSSKSFLIADATFVDFPYCGSLKNQHEQLVFWSAKIKLRGLQTINCFIFYLRCSAGCLIVSWFPWQPDGSKPEIWSLDVPHIRHIFNR